MRNSASTPTEVIDRPSTVDPKFARILDSLVKGAEEAKTPENVRVLLHNDDLTPYNLVVQVLVQVFRLEEHVANVLMHTVHRTGHPGIVCVLPEPEALARIDDAANLSRGYPLRFSTEKA